MNREVNRELVLELCVFEIQSKMWRYKEYLKFDDFPYEDKEHCIRELKFYEDIVQYLKDNLK